MRMKMVEIRMRFEIRIPRSGSRAMADGMLFYTCSVCRCEVEVSVGRLLRHEHRVVAVSG